MKYSQLTKYPMLKKWLLAKMGYFAQYMYEFENGKLTKQTNFDPTVVIVAKCHYREQWESFSAINKKDVQKIISLKRKSARENLKSFQLFTNKNIDGFDLKTTIFDEGFTEKLGTKKIFIPETELFLSEPSTSYIYQIATPLGILFSGGYGNKTTSSYAHGLLRELATYKLSIGMPVNVQSKLVESQDFPTFLIKQLVHRPKAKLLSQLVVKPWAWIDVKQLHVLYWAPLIAALVFYVFTNSYFFVYNNFREHKLATQSAEISTVLNNKNLYDKHRGFLEVLSIELNERKLVHYYWNIIEQLLDENMTISSISFRNNLLTVRGKADKASQVLDTMTTNKYLKNISFKGQVRKSRGQEAFTLEILPSQYVSEEMVSKQHSSSESHGQMQ